MQVLVREDITGILLCVALIHILTVYNQNAKSFLFVNYEL